MCFHLPGQLVTVSVGITPEMLWLTEVLASLLPTHIAEDHSFRSGHSSKWEANCSSLGVFSARTNIPLVPGGCGIIWVRPLWKC